MTAVATAAEAMDGFEQSRPDIIVSDIGLPEEDGYHLLQRIRSLELERNELATPAIALTAFAANKDRRNAREAGFHKHLAKPVDAGGPRRRGISTLLCRKRPPRQRRVICCGARRLVPTLRVGTHARPLRGPALAQTTQSVAASRSHAERGNEGTIRYIVCSSQRLVRAAHENVSYRCEYQERNDHERRKLGRTVSP